MMLGLVAALYWVSNDLMTAGFLELEKRNVEMAAHRVEASLQSEVETIGTVLRDWSEWDDTYEFIRNPNQAYIDGNLTPEALVGVRLSFMIFLDTDGRVVRSNWANLETEEGIPPPKEGLSEIVAACTAALKRRAKDHVDGVLPTARGIALIAAGPILTSRKTGPSRGTLIFGRFLDERTITDIENQNLLEITIRTRNDSAIPIADRESIARITSNTPTVAKPLSETSVAGFSAMRDILNKESIIIGTVMRRDIMIEGRVTNLLLGSVLGLAAVLFGLIAVALVDRLVITRISKVDARVREIAETGNTETRVPEMGCDEIGRVSMTINELLDSIEAARTTEQLYSAQLKEALARAEEATHMKSRFLANMSHELRTPLNGVIGMSELLLKTSLSPEQKDYVNTAISSGESLLAIISDILDLSKLEAGKLTLERVEFNLRELVEDAASLVSATAQRKQVEVIANYPSSVPSTFFGDPTRVRQVILNILSNAAKFTDLGEIEVKVDWRFTGLVGWLTIRVRDTGVGIPANRLDSVFDSFSQADESTTRRYGGTGLGLPICRDLVRLMGGEISVESIEGKGTVFTVEIPLQVGVGSEAGIRHEFAGLTALVATENALQGDVVTDMLFSWGWEVERASDFEDALARAPSGAYSCIIVGSALLGRRPQDGLQELLDAAGETRLIVLAPVAESFGHWEFESSRPPIVVAKPVRTRALLRAIQEATSRVVSPDVSDSERSESPSHLCLRVLLAEDNPVNRKLAARMLSLLNCEVQIAEHGKAAVSLFEEQRFDVILMDCFMPVMDGFEATRRIRDLEAKLNRPRIPIIAVTADALDGAVQRCRACGMDHHLPKPFRLSDLVDVLKRACPNGGWSEEAA